MHAMSPTPFETKTQQHGESARVAVLGELDLATSPLLEQEAKALLDDDVRHLTIDLSALTFVDSSGLRLLISLNDRARAEGWRLSLIGPGGPARTVFQVSGAEAHLPFTADDEEGQTWELGSADERRDDNDTPLVGESLS
jgi:anti-anti-sigma factor